MISFVSFTGKRFSHVNHRNMDDFTTSQICGYWIVDSHYIAHHFFKFSGRHLGVGNFGMLLYCQRTSTAPLYGKKIFQKWSRQSNARTFSWCSKKSRVAEKIIRSYVLFFAKLPMFFKIISWQPSTLRRVGQKQELEIFHNTEVTEFLTGCCSLLNNLFKCPLSWLKCYSRENY